MKCVKPTGTASILDRDIGSFYPSSIQAIITVPKYMCRQVGENNWVVYTTNESVHKWISEFLPSVTEYQGDLYFNNSEYMLLILKFGAGKAL